MDLKLEQVQIFQEGRMISSSGISSLTLLPTFEKKNNYRLKREDSNDVTSYMQAQTTFDIQLQSRQRRSSAYSIPDETDKDSYYQPASRMAEMEVKGYGHKYRLISLRSFKNWKLQFLQESDIDTEAIFQNLLYHKDEDYDEKLQALFEMVEREINLELDKENGSISNAIRQSFSEEVMQNLCSKNFSVCKDFLQLLAMTGGPEAEDVSDIFSYTYW
ncbi:uncharacterized protein CEXT_489261 [Caerostris extrusa]|uniref:Uncharacterized protein n=1 Tax=Caerostris extrusa TaxID=172846 RepID=A0AAV4UMF3_CAEEX|nr:uncharacterized protein CEXT_489261 [Caerostris extrusa]